MHVRSAGRRRRQGFRPDIEGLRAVAILAVVAFHARVRFLDGGYIGVDVFFVISGYLITGLLWRELSGDRRISFARFYGRRVRRLLPASILVVVATAIAAGYILPPLEVHSVWKDGLASAFYVANYRFAATQTNYLSVTTSPSPFLHYWSLGVEEQFYVVWPLVLVLASLVWRRRAPSQVGATAGLATVGVLSFVLSLWLTGAAEPWAFYSLASRAWELAAGGLVALGTPLLRRLPPSVLAPLGWAGLAAVVWSAFAFTTQTPFPGVAALAPVLGTAAIITGGLGASPWGPVWLLKRAAMRWMGRISYSWYLWHWPVLVLVPVAVGHALPEWQEVGLAAGTGILALLSYLLVENPIRSSAWLAATSRRSLATGGALSAVGGLACLLAVVTLPPIQGHGKAPVARLASPVSEAAVHHSAGGQRQGPGGRPATNSPDSPRARLTAQLAATTRQAAAGVARSVGVTHVPSNLAPPLSDPTQNEAPVFFDGCMDGFTADNVLPCEFGDTSSTTSVALVGDSHATMWFPAMDRAANAEHWKLLVMTKATCPPVLVPLFSPDLDQPFTACSTWLANVLARIRAVHPALVVLAMSPLYDPAFHVTQDGPQWFAGLTRMIATLRHDGARVVVMGPIPAPTKGVIPECLSANLTNVPACNIAITSGVLPQQTGVDVPGLAAERATVQRAGATFVDVEPWFCTATTCPVIVDNLLVYRDDSHLTTAFSSYLAPLVTDELRLALLPGPG